MTREERARDAADLRAQGLTGVAIAEIMGLSRSYTYALLNDPDGNADRLRKPHGVCEVCGGPTSYNTGGVARTCQAHNPAGRIRGAQMREAGLPRRRLILELWHKGWKTGQIAAAVGTSKGTVSVMIARMRAEGWDLPHRHRGYEKKTGAAQAVASTASCPGAAVDLAAPAEGR